MEDSRTMASPNPPDRVWGIKLADDETDEQTNSTKLLRMSLWQPGQGKQLQVCQVTRQAVEHSPEWMLCLARRLLGKKARNSSSYKPGVVNLQFGGGYETIVMVDVDQSKTDIPVDLKTVKTVVVQSVVAPTTSEDTLEAGLARPQTYGVNTFEDPMYDHCAGLSSKDVRIYLHPTAGFLPRVGAWGEDLDRKRIFLLETHSKHPFQIIALDRSTALESQLANDAMGQSKTKASEGTAASKVNKPTAQTTKKKEKSDKADKSTTASKASTKKPTPATKPTEKSKDQTVKKTPATTTDASENSPTPKKPSNAEAAMKSSTEKEKNKAKTPEKGKAAKNTESNTKGGKETKKMAPSKSMDAKEKPVKKSSAKEKRKADDDSNRGNVDTEKSGSKKKRKSDDDSADRGSEEEGKKVKKKKKSQSSMETAVSSAASAEKMKAKDSEEEDKFEPVKRPMFSQKNSDLPSHRLEGELSAHKKCKSTKQHSCIYCSWLRFKAREDEVPKEKLPKVSRTQKFCAYCRDPICQEHWDDYHGRSRHTE